MDLTPSKRWQDPYGGDRGTPAPAWPDKHGFLGGYQNTTGVTHIGARDYDPLTGRFMTADPVLDTGDPQALNAYSYGNNSPVSFSDPTGMVLQIDGRPAYIGSDAMASMSPANWERAYRYNVGVARNHINAVTHRTPPTYPAFVGKENHQYSPAQRRARWETQFAYWSLEPPDRRPPDYDQFKAAFCSEFSDLSECETRPEHDGPPSIEGAIMALTLLIPWGAAFRLGGEFVAGAVAGIEGSVWAGGAIAGGVRAGALGDLGASVTASKIAAAAARGEGVAGRCMNSFTGDTPVLMGDGSSKPIAEVKVGDEVSNSEPGASLVERHVVTALHITDDDHDFVDIAVLTSSGPRTIVTTAHHPFWNATDHAWTDAADLEVGDLLSTPGAGFVTIGSVRRYTGANRTFNLTVETVHTYYVLAGLAPVLVHNCGGLGDPWQVADRVSGARDGHIWRLHGPGTPARSANGTASKFGVGTSPEDVIDQVMAGVNKDTLVGPGRIPGTHIHEYDTGIPGFGTVDGVSTSWIRVFVDDAGNLGTTFPILR